MGSHSASVGHGESNTNLTNGDLILRNLLNLKQNPLFKSYLELSFMMPGIYFE